MERITRTEEQIIGVLQAHEAGSEWADPGPLLAN